MTALHTHIVAASCRSSAEDVEVPDATIDAAVGALGRAGWQPRDVDCILVVTPPALVVPSELVGARLGLASVPTIALAHSSCSYIHALSIGDHFIRAGTHARVLLLALDEPVPEAGGAHTVDASVTLLGPGFDPGSGILATGLRTDGRFAIPAPAVPLGAEDIADPRAIDALREGYHHIRTAFTEALAAILRPPGDVALVVINEDVVPVARQACRRLGIPLDRLLEPDVTDDAGLPRLLTSAVDAGRVTRGDVVLLASFGGRFSSAWAAVRW